MRSTFLLLLSVGLTLSTSNLIAQETLTLPYVLYGEASEPAEALASPSDRQIAALLIAERRYESRLADVAWQKTQNLHVKQLAERILRDNAAICHKLQGWASLTVESDNQPKPEESAMPWFLIRNQIAQRSLATSVSDLREVSASRLDETYLEMQQILSQRQIDACKVLSPQVSAGFRNQLETLQELSWNHSKTTSEILGLTSARPVALVRR
jgi:hypothetical protein